MGTYLDNFERVKGLTLPELELHNRLRNAMYEKMKAEEKRRGH